jgi:hypothetical protein
MRSRIFLLTIPVAFSVAIALLLVPLEPDTDNGAIGGTSQPLVASLLAGRLGSTTALARRVISIPFGIETPLALSANNRLIRVAGHTGQVDCEAGLQFHVRVTVTQQSTGAVAEGHAQERCTGGSQTWEALATTRGRTVFESGEALVCGFATVRDREDRGAIIFTRQWCRAITLTTT